MTNIHDDLPFGTPPLDMRFSLGEASMLEKQAARQSGRRRPRTDSSTTEESFSASSCADESLPDDDPTITDNRINSNSARGNEAAIENFASTLARRRIVEPPRTTTPQLLDLFPSPPVQHVDRTTSVPNALGINLSASHSAASSKTVPQHPIVKRSTVMTRASGFLQKLRPQLSVDMSPVLQRRFSFEPGDDFAAQLIPSENLSPHITKTLRKSVSLCTLLDDSKMKAVDRSLSPVAPSPTTSAPVSEGRSQSRIPTPVFSFNALARPRQEREDSSSSLLTVIQHSDENVRRSTSRASSVYSSPSVSRTPSSYEVSSMAGNLKSKSSNRLLNHTLSLRGSPSSLAVAAARAANAGETVSLAGSIGGERRSSAKSSHSAMSMQSDGGDLRRENSRPC